MKSKLTIPLLLLIYTFHCWGIQASNFRQQDKDKNKRHKINKIVTQYTTLDWFNGIVFVAVDSQPLYQYVTGFANKDYNIPNSLSTHFNIGSIAQVFTATAVMQLVESGKIKIKERLSTYLPTIAKQLPNDLTIHQLLSHTSGLANCYDRAQYEKNFFEVEHLEDLVKVIVKSSKSVTLNQQLNPIPSNYILLAAIIEKVTGLPYKQYIRKKIFDTSNMGSTLLAPYNEQIKNRVIGYVKKQEGELAIAPNIWRTYPFGSGGMYTNALDLHQFTQAFFGGQLLTDSYKNKMLRNYEYTAIETEEDIDAEDGYSYGWRTKRYEPYKIIYQNSTLPGLNATCRVYQGEQKTYTLILLSNIDADKTLELAAHIDNIIVEGHATIPKSSVNLLTETIIKELGIDYLLDNFEALLQKKGLILRQFSDLESLGRSYQQEGKWQIALKLHQLNRRYFPENEFVQENIGNIQLLLGNYAAALSSFEQKLELVHTKEAKKRRTLALIEQVKKEQAEACDEQAKHVFQHFLEAGKPELTAEHTKYFKFIPATKESASKTTTTNHISEVALLIVSNQNEALTTASVTEGVGESLVDNFPKETLLQIPPHFKGGQPALSQYLNRQLKRTTKKFISDKKVTVYISFVINGMGTITNPQIVQSGQAMQYEYDQEALRIVQAMPKWEPGYYKGKTVSTYYLLPILFNGD